MFRSLDLEPLAHPDFDAKWTFDFSADKYRPQSPADAVYVQKFLELAKRSGKQLIWSREKGEPSPGQGFHIDAEFDARGKMKLQLVLQRATASMRTTSSYDARITMDVDGMEIYISSYSASEANANAAARHLEHLYEMIR